MCSTHFWSDRCPRTRDAYGRSCSREPRNSFASACRRTPSLIWPWRQPGAIVARIVEYIHAGDAFQVVPSQRWSGAEPVQAFSIYRGLRAVNPSPYMYFLDFADFQVAGTSAERVFQS